MRQDYLKRMIEEMGRVLGSALARIIGTEGNERVLEAIANFKAEMKEQGLDIDKLIEMSVEETPQYLKTHYVSPDHADSLARILFRIGELSPNVRERRQLFEKSLEICFYASGGGKNYSRTREDLCAKITQHLQTL